MGLDTIDNYKRAISKFFYYNCKTFEIGVALLLPICSSTRTAVASLVIRDYIPYVSFIAT